MPTVLSRKSGGSGGGGTPSGPAGGDLAGTYPNPTLAAGVVVFDLLHDEVLAGAQTSFDIQNIPGTYKHLRLIVMGRASAASNQQNVLVRFNNDSGNNYSAQKLTAQGGTIAGSGTAGVGSMDVGFVAGNSATAGNMGANVMDIPDYAGTTFRKSLVLTGNAALASWFLTGGSGFWANTAAITRITVLLDSGDFMAGSRATLYGMD